MQTQQMQVEQRATGHHPIAAVLVWVFAAIAVMMTGLLAWVLAALASEWSGYVGGESGAALAITGFVGAVTITAWLLTWLTARVHRQP